jgi:hypothetical protein
LEAGLKDSEKTIVLTGSTGLRKKNFAPAGWISRIVSWYAKKDPVILSKSV